MILELDSQAQILLLGSRLDNSAKGVEIDLLIISEVLTRRDVRTVKILLQDQLVVQKFEIVLSTSKLLDPFAKLAPEAGYSL